MNKKKVIIIVISIVILLLAAGLIFFLSKGKKKGVSKETELFAETDYPCKYKQVKDGLEITLDGSKTPELSWEYEISNQYAVDVAIKDKEKNGKATFKITGKGGGSTNVIFKRVYQLAGKSYDAAKIELILFALQNDNGGYDITVSELAIQNSANMAEFATDTEYPFMIKTDDNGMTTIVFPNGSYDWMYYDTSGKTGYSISHNISEGSETFYINSLISYEDESEATTEATTSVSSSDESSSEDTFEVPAEAQNLPENTSVLVSKNLGLTAYIKYEISSEGIVTLTLTDKPKDK